ncbi:MAG: hypothetical protein MJ007_01730 [Paludibacteraceae bacterium]|nr:hypothetical protein [Paludibacteraceae bacterium]
MTPNDFLHIIEKQQAQIQKLVNNDLSIKVGRAAKDHFQENFALGGYVDGGLHRWQPAL